MREMTSAALRLKCPRCRKGNLYRNILRMNEKCPECDLQFTAEPGFYVGSIYPNYAVTVILVTALYWIVAFVLQMGQDRAMYISLAFFVLFPLWFHRYARSIWMAIIYNIRNSQPENGPKQEQSIAKKDH